MMAEAATDQKLGTLLRMHEAAFHEWGAVPEEILYDRMRTIWTGTDERGEIIWNAVFLDFARYWGFTPRLCRPYRAQTKGKVESGVCSSSYSAPRAPPWYVVTAEHAHLHGYGRPTVTIQRI
jgi:transposase